jgi:hypothetical protein
MDWLGWFLPRFQLRRQPLESLAPPHADDLDRLAELREMGSKLELPHPVRTFLVFGTETRARDAGEQLRKEGFSCQLRASADGTWLLTSVLQVVPTPGAITRLREQMEALGSNMDGTYRGWDAPVVY